jgi:hypothetical protein
MPENHLKRESAKMRRYGTSPSMAAIVMEYCYCYSSPWPIAFQRNKRNHCGKDETSLATTTAF